MPLLEWSGNFFGIYSMKMIGNLIIVQYIINTCKLSWMFHNARGVMSSEGRPTKDKEGKALVWKHQQEKDEKDHGETALRNFPFLLSLASFPTPSLLFFLRASIPSLSEVLHIACLLLFVAVTIHDKDPSPC